MITSATDKHTITTLQFAITLYYEVHKLEFKYHISHIQSITVITGIEISCNNY